MNMKYTWLNTDEYPFKSNYFDVDGYKMHYIDEGEGETILFIHGTPSWSFEYRHIIKKLREAYRCVAIDHIGFGLSDKPKNYDYSLQRHSENLENFINKKGLANLTLVVHDFGGPIGFYFALKYPERIKKLIILNTWMWSFENNSDFIKMKKVLQSPLLPVLYKYFNFSPKILLPKSFGKKKISTKILKQYTAPFANAGERNGTLAFAKSLLNDQEWFEKLWSNRERITEKPALFIWGMKDPFLKPDFLNTFLSEFRNARSVFLSDCGHFPQEEEPEACIASIQAFLREQNMKMTTS